VVLVVLLVLLLYDYFVKKFGSIGLGVLGGEQPDSTIGVVYMYFDGNSYVLRILSHHIVKQRTRVATHATTPRVDWQE